MESGVSFGAFGVTGLTIKGNSIFSNGGLGIDLGVNGVTLNDDGDVDSGVNDLQNFPVITQVTRGANFTNFSGRLDAACSGEKATCSSWSWRAWSPANRA